MTILYNICLGVEYSQIAHTTAVTRYNIHEGLRTIDSRTQIQGMFFKEYGHQHSSCLICSFIKIIRCNYSVFDNIVILIIILNN